jgi:aspartate racemase
MTREMKVIGVLGGMGPLATADFFQKLIQATPATFDQDHLKVLIFSNPQIPDRTAAIRGEGPSPLPALIASAEALVRAGADFLTMPCVTAHAFFDGLQQAVRIPILHLIGETVAWLRREQPSVRRLGLLATTGTLQSHLFETECKPHGLIIVTPEPAIQTAQVMGAIYAVKHGGALEAPRGLIRDAAAHLQRLGVEAVVAGCTEIPLLLRDGDLSISVIDPTMILAEAAVRRALVQTPPLSPVQRCYKDRG